MAGNKQKKPIAAYVQAPDKSPLMPCRSNGRVKRLLKSGRARIVTTYPFTIRLNYEPETKNTQRVLVGPDPGRNNVGLAAILGDGEVLYAANAETQNADIKVNMRDRKMYRQLRRQYQRKIRKHFARRNGNTFQMKFRFTGMGKRPHAMLKRRKDYPHRDLVQERYHNLTADQFRFVWMRILPSYENPVILHDIVNTEARFSNRVREDGWLTPTARHLLETHLNLVRLVMKILPVSDIILEVNKFDIAKMDHPDWWGENYCHGPLYGYEGRNREEKLHAAVDDLQKGHCIFCRKKIGHYHHITPLSRGGRDIVSNVAGVCEEHHARLHKNKPLFREMADKKEKLNKNNGLLSVINQIMPCLKEGLEKIPGVRVHYTDGKTTKKIRELYHLPKDHYIDAWCIAVSALKPEEVGTPEFPKETLFSIKQFRRHNRACVNHTMSRKYKDADEKTVATNRKKAILAVPKDDGTLEEKEQTERSLAEYRETLVTQYLEGLDNPTDADRAEALKEAERAISRLTVKKSCKVYNNLERVMPGAVYREKETGKRIVMQGQQNRGEVIKQAYAGLDPAKSYVRHLRKTIGKLKKGKNADPDRIKSLEARIAEVESCYPEVRRYNVSRLKLITHNTGLVYVQDHICQPA